MRYIFFFILISFSAGFGMFDIARTALSPHEKVELALDRDETPHWFFVPNRGQFDLIREIGTSVPEKRIFLVTSGNGYGKTTVAINILANIIYPNSNIFRNVKDLDSGEVFDGFFDWPLYNNFPENWPKQAWYVSNADSLKAIVDEFWKWFQESQISGHKEGKNYVSRINFHGSGWKLYFKTIDQEPETFESANVSIVIFDEPPPIDLFRAAVSRLRAGGIIIIPATPLFHAAWFVDEIIEKVQEHGDKVHQTVSVWENCIEKAGSWDLGTFGIQPKGNLRQADIEFTLRNYDPEEREAREHGIFKHLSGLVYKTYKRDIHFVDIPSVAMPAYYMYRFILDPHDRKPPAAIWIRIDKNGWHWDVVKEYPCIQDNDYHGLPFQKIKSSDPLTVADFVKRFIEIFNQLEIPRDRLECVIDPNFGRKPNRITGKMIYEEYQDEFRKQGYPIVFITDVVDCHASGHKQVKEWLKAGSDGDVKLRIDKTCINTDWSFRNYSHADWEGKAKESKSLREDVKEIGKDHMDLIRYGVMVPFYWREHKTYSKGKGDYSYHSEPARPEGARGV